MKLSARPAAIVDLADIAHLLADASAANVGERGGAVFVHREAVAEPFVERLAELLADPTVLVAVGTLDDITMGSALATRETIRDGTVLARLEHLWVEPGAREVGLGGELIDLVTRWARAAGAARLDAYALPGNRAAKNFLETAGFSARLLVMHRRLEESDGGNHRAR